MAMIRVEIPFHLQNFARSGPEVLLEVSSPVTINTVLDALD
jgi:molybdopterin synthase sulfur carrier subunit